MEGKKQKKSRLKNGWEKPKNVDTTSQVKKQNASFSNTHIRIYILRTLKWSVCVPKLPLSLSQAVSIFSFKNLYLFLLLLSLVSYADRSSNRSGAYIFKFSRIMVRKSQRKTREEKKARQKLRKTQQDKLVALIFFFCSAFCFVCVCVIFPLRVCMLNQIVCVCVFVCEYEKYIPCSLNYKYLAISAITACLSYVYLSLSLCFYMN